MNPTLNDLILNLGSLGGDQGSLGGSQGCLRGLGGV